MDVIPDATDYPNAEGWTFKGSLTGEQWAEAPSTPTYGFSAQAVEADGISRGELTGIGQMDARTGQVTFDREAWYTLDGVSLSGKPATNGVYINNGKMVVIK